MNKEISIEDIIRTNLDSTLIFKYVKELQQENQQLKQKRDLYNSVFDEANEFLKKFNNYKNRFKWCEQDYIDTIDKIGKILDKANIKENK